MPRAISAVLAVVVVTGGLGGRAVLPAAVAGPLGDSLYAVLVVLLLALVAPRTRPVVAGAVALAVCAAVEASHLTGLPAEVVERVPAARFVLGSAFAVEDLAWYALGAAAGAVLLAVFAPRSRWVDQGTRHGRRDDGQGPRQGHGRGRALVAALVALVVAAGGGVGWYMWDEAEDLDTRLAAARTSLDESEGRVADDAVRAALAVRIDEAEALLASTPILDRLPGEATQADERLARDVAEVDESRLTFALAEAGDARDALQPVTRRAERVLAAADELGDDGLDAGRKVRAALREALEAVDGALAAAAPDQLDGAALAQVEQSTASLEAGRSDVRRATVELMTAQDAVVCPYPDQVWFPEAGKLDAARLVAIPWAPEHSVRADVVDGLVELNDAYRARFGEDLTVNSAYRTYAQQLEVYNPDDPNPLAAPPGCSNHGLGTAVDLSVGSAGFASARFAWLKDNAERFGWTHPDWAGPDGRLPEPWHWQSVRTPTEY